MLDLNSLYQDLQRRRMAQPIMQPQLAPRMGPDIQPMASPAPLNWAAMPQLQGPPDTRNLHDLGKMIGQTGQRLFAPSKIGMMPGTAGKVKLFARGGKLRKAGDVAIVGDEGPELAVRGKSETRIVPLLTPPQPEYTRPPAAEPAQSVRPTILFPPALSPDAANTDAGFQLRAPQFPDDGFEGRPAVGPPALSAPVAQQGAQYTRPLPAPEPPLTRPRITQPPPALTLPVRSQPLETTSDLNAGVFQRPVQALAPALPADTIPLGNGSTYEPIRYSNNPQQERGVNEVSRERIAQPLEYAERRYEQRRLEAPKKMSRGRAALVGFGEGALRSLMAGGGVGGALVGGATGATVGAVSPGRIAQLQHDKLIARDEATVNDLLEQRGGRAKLDLTQANADYARNIKPAEYQRKVDEDKRRAEQRGYTNAMALLRVKRGQRIDPANPRDAHLLDQFEAQGIFIDPDEWNSAAGNLIPVTVVDEENPTQTRRKVFNKLTGQLGDVGQAGYVAPIHPETEMTAPQEAVTTDRRVGQAETRRHNRATEAQGGERIGISRENQAQRGQPTANTTNTRLARAAELARKLEEEKTRAAHPPGFNPATGQPVTPEYQRAYTARHLGLARGYAQQIKDAYADVYESGVGEGDYPYAKPRVQPGARPQGGGASARPRIRQANVPAAVDDLIKAGRFKDKQAAEKYVREHMDVIQ